MYVIIVGCGRVGSQLATFLSEEGHDVAIIDKDQNAFRRLGSTFNGLTVKGLGFDQDVLKEAGIEQADAFAAVTDLDNTNMMAVEVATRLFNVPRAIARLYNPTRALTYEKLGLNYICGTTMLAEKLFQTILAPDMDIVSTVGQLLIVKAKASKKLADMKLADVEQSDHFRIITIIREAKNIFCEAETKIKEGDDLIFIARKTFLPEIQKLISGEVR